MMVADELTNIENAVERTKAAVIEEATAITRLRREIALIIEAQARPS
jgi:16S rRNA C1402 (ribose-2'-O) methylase RsmI